MLERQENRLASSHLFIKKWWDTPVPAAVLDVQDTGCGVRVEDLSKLFERFYRTDASHGRSYEGTGIGLALTMELVKVHGGRVAVESSFGQATPCSPC